MAAPGRSSKLASLIRDIFEELCDEGVGRPVSRFPIPAENCFAG
jgi:hypothetical protein